MKRRTSKPKRATVTTRTAKGVPQVPVASVSDFNEITGMNYLERGEQYTCSKCRLTLEDSDDREAVERLPFRNDVPRSKMWFECPGDGPTSWDLWDPADHSIQRSRMRFDHDGRVIRVCTPVVRSRHYTRDDNREVFHVGGAMTLYEIRVAWSVKDRVARHGPARTPDLGLLQQYGLHRGQVPLPIKPSTHGSWAVPLQYRWNMTPWETKVMTSAPLKAVGADRDYPELLNKVLVARFLGGVPGLGDTDKSTLSVPLDLRRNLDQQWDVLRPKLRQTQDVMLAFCGRMRAHDGNLDTASRNLYCYLLSARAGWTATQIATEVFSLESSKAAASKVRKILHDIRTALAASESIERDS